MPESDTTILRRAKDGASKHAGTAFGGLSTAAVIFIYATFVPKADFQRHVDESAQKRSKVWQELMDTRVELDRMKRRFSAIDATTNAIAENSFQDSE